METITLTLKEGDMDTIEVMAHELRSTPEETAVGLILYALNQDNGNTQEASKAFQGKILYEIVQYFDERPASWNPPRSDVRIDDEIIDIAISRAESKGEGLQTYFARLVRQEAESAKEPALVETGSG